MKCPSCNEQEFITPIWMDEAEAEGGHSCMTCGLVAPDPVWDRLCEMRAQADKLKPREVYFHPEKGPRGAYLDRG